MATNEVLEILDRAKARYELIPHAHTETALDEARELGFSPGEVAKTLVVETSAGHVRAVIPASERLDLRKLKSALHVAGKPHLLTEEDLEREYPEFELGSVAPIGGHPDAVVVDVGVARHDEVVIEAGSHAESMRLRTADLIMVAGATVADISVEHQP